MEMNSKLIFTISLVLLLLVSQVSAIPTSILIGKARTTPFIPLQTTFGQTSTCADYPTDGYGQVFSGPITASGQNPGDLINFYACVNNHPSCSDGWKFVTEKSSPASFDGRIYGYSSNQLFTYESYACNQLNVCSGISFGAKCISETEVANCISGAVSSKTSCPSGNYCDGGRCISFTSSCRELWISGAWSECKKGNIGDCIGYDSGCRTRTVYDSANCGTTLYRPISKETCIYVPTVGDITSRVSEAVKVTVDLGGTTSGFVATPEIEPLAIQLGGSITVKAKFYAATSGEYLLEAGVEKIGGLKTLATVGENFIIKSNFCDPADSHYANQRLKLSTGANDLTFTLQPNQGEGTYIAHVAWIRGCTGLASDILNQIDSPERIKVSTEAPSPSILTSSSFSERGFFGVANWILIFFLLSVLGLLIYWRFKR